MKRIPAVAAVAFLLAACGPSGRPISGRLAANHPAGTSAVVISGSNRTVVPLSSNGSFSLRLASPATYHLKFVVGSGSSRSVIGTAMHGGTPLKLEGKKASGLDLGDLGTPSEDLTEPATPSCDGEGQDVEVESQTAADDASGSDAEAEQEDGDACGGDNESGK